jgi:uracil-DNA glycosylase
MAQNNVQIEESWKALLADEFEQPYFFALKQFLKQEKENGATIYPPGSLIFNAYHLTPVDQVKVVIIGQDPYHGPGQAHGLCFSVPDGVKPPPSLLNIFREIEEDCGVSMSGSGNLTPWARQGVFLLNAILTVRRGEPTSHQGKGWETFTRATIRRLSERREGLVFLLWGKYAQGTAQWVDRERHYIFEAAHPSPYSAHKGFFGCHHFSRTNEVLQAQNHHPIDWRL